MFKTALLLVFIQAALTSCGIIRLGVGAREEHPREKELSAIPDQLDWRTKGVVTPVRNQGSMGRSVIIIVVEMIESELAVQYGQLNALSVQQIVDCCPTCNSGVLDPKPILKYIQEHGLERESDYPLHPGVNSSCKYDSTRVVQGTRIASFRTIVKGNETDLKVACATIGPLFVAIDAERSLELYRSGIFYDKNCDPDKLNHAMLLVGYGIEGVGDYWLLKNSWGVEWGEEGYMKLGRNRNDECGIANLAFAAIIK